MNKRYTFLPKNWLRIGTLIAFTVSISFSAFAQNGPAKQWDKTFGGTLEDNLYSLQQTSDGGYIVGGTSLSDIGGNKTTISKGATDYWILKLDSKGNKVWEKAFGGAGEDELYSLQQTSDGGYILGGSSSTNLSSDKSQSSFGLTDYWILKLDANGNKIWDKTFGGADSDILRSVQQTKDGGYILGGHSKSGISGNKTQPSNGLEDYWIIKLDSNGNQQWDKTFGGSAADYQYSIKQTKDGGYILGGYSWSGIGGDKSQASVGASDYWVVKLDMNGSKQWDKTYGGTLPDLLQSLQQTTDGGYILGGFSLSPISGDKSDSSNGNIDYWVIKINANGMKQWDKVFGGSASELARCIQQTSNGDYIIGGISSSDISGNKTENSRGQGDYWVTKMDSLGNKIWDKTIGSFNQDYLTFLQQTSDGGYILGGYSDSNPAWDKSQNSNGRTDFWLVKLGADITGIKETEANFSVSISPNPNHGKFTLQLSNLTAPKAEVTVSDLLGRVVLQQQLTVSNNQLSEELTLPNAKGMYLLQLKVGQQLLTRKIVVE